MHICKIVKRDKIDDMPPELRNAVIEMLLGDGASDGARYREVVEYVRENGGSISQASLCRYLQRLQGAATVENEVH